MQGTGALHPKCFDSCPQLSSCLYEMMTFTMTFRFFPPSVLFFNAGHLVRITLYTVVGISLLPDNKKKVT
jgi:hypothetical protein